MLEYGLESCFVALSHGLGVFQFCSTRIRIVLANSLAKQFGLRVVAARTNRGKWAFPTITGPFCKP